MEVAILDEIGDLSGANNWKGLLDQLHELVTEVQAEGLYTRHECNLCCQSVNIDGSNEFVRGAVADGFTEVRRPKCAIYGCPDSPCAKRGARCEQKNSF